MIRTTLSFGLLFGGLLLISKWMHQLAPRQPELHDAAPAIREAHQPEAHARDSAHKPEAPARDSAAFRSHFPIGQLRELNDPLPTIQLVAFDEPLQIAADTLRPSTGTRARVADEDLNETTTQDLQQPTSPSSPSADLQPEIVITPQLQELRNRLRECLAWYYFRPENVAIRSPWGAMHAMIAYGVDSELIAGDKRVNAIGYLNFNGVCNGQQLFYLSNGTLQARIGPGVQGHAGQYLAMLAQSRVKTDFPMQVEGRKFTVADLIQYEKDTCRPKTELTFKLIAFMHYLKSDDKWRSNDGQEWDLPRLIKEELAQPIVGAACGGTHRMTGFSYAVRKREQRGEPFTGQWQRAKTFVDDFHEYAFRLQNADGSFSTDWFAGRADNGPHTKRLETTGHITEWLAYSLDKEQLVEPRMIKSVSYLTNLLIEHRDEKWGIGPLGHGLHALALYDERIFGGQPGTRAVELAEVRKNRRSVER